MKKRLTALFIFAIALISVFSLASCGPKEDSGNKNPEPSSGIEKVEVVTTGDYGTRGLYLKSDKVEGYDYTPCFSIKVDGNDVEVKSEYIDASAVQAANGTYVVTCTYKNASATLSVNVYEKASVYLISSQYEVNGISLPRDLAEEHDYTQYFMINAGGASVEVKPEYIDSSAVKNVIGTYTVTCTYEGAATNPKEPPYTGGKNFDHWYTSDDNGATETARYATGTAITADTTIYAAWVDANILYGKYLGFEVYGKTYDSPYLTNGKSAEIDVNGKATSGSRISGSTVSDYSNGFFKFGSYYGYYDEVSKILVYNDSTGTGAQNDVYILFKGATSVVTDKAKYFIITDGGTQKLIDVTVTVDGVESSFTIYFHDKKVEKVTWTADEGMTKVSDLFSVKTNIWSAGSIKTNVLKIYDLSGNLIGDFMKNGSKMVELDGSQGTYTLDGGENLVLTGTGVASIGTDEGTVTKAADGSSYTYDLYITQGGENVYYELTIDKEAKTYSLNKPMVTLSFDLDGKGTMASVSINKNIEYALASPTYDGYKFEGWYTGKTVGDDGNVTYTGSVMKLTPTENTTVYAKWAKAITVTFETEHGTAPDTQLFK